MRKKRPMATVKTTFLVLSDTHGETFPADRQPPKGADVVLHCGDLTEMSKISEFHTTLNLLKDIGAPLTLVIAGNHDFTLDPPAFHRKVAEAGLESEIELLAREYGRDGEVRQLFEDARISHNIHLLDEGTHEFQLDNGASLKVYASPYTTTPEADWGFQYRPTDEHKFEIHKGTDIAVTHSPPEGILDRSSSQPRLGIRDLFASVARSRPLMHCFGHVHGGWGAKLAAWRDIDKMELAKTDISHFTAIDNRRSTVLDTLQSFQRDKFDDDATATAKSQRLALFKNQCYRPASHLLNGYKARTHTLFVNAAIKGVDEEDQNLPWLVDLDLAESSAGAN
ncbi:hypothetical protein SBRCBS47491_008009 [Sporothrix bragantina]|uniref:Calcineurin-like phosphoesterase domain-containing protein n=1 Tax=Sporothrix bragantina TaxID=671064 RepID=A0ABP0CIA0_9PEZI